MTAKLPNRVLRYQPRDKRKGVVKSDDALDAMDEAFAVNFMAGAVLETSDSEWEPTGLLNADGEPLYRYVKQPLGFLWHDEYGELRLRQDFEDH